MEIDAFKLSEITAPRHVPQLVGRYGGYEIVAAPYSINGLVRAFCTGHQRSPGNGASSRGLINQYSPNTNKAAPSIACAAVLAAYSLSYLHLSRTKAN